MSSGKTNDTLESKLGFLIEECGEVMHAVGKTLRWGPESYDPGQPPGQQEANAAWVLRELRDLRKAIDKVEHALLMRDRNE